MRLEPSRTTLYYMDSPASPHRRGSTASIVLLLLAAAGMVTQDIALRAQHPDASETRLFLEAWPLSLVWVGLFVAGVVIGWRAS